MSTANRYPNIVQDAAGWPQNLPKEEQVALVAACQHILSVWRKPASLGSIYYWVKGQNIGPTFNKAALLDWRYCAVERALRECANEVWELKPEG